MPDLYYAIFLGFFSGIFGSWIGYVLFHWGHLRFQLGLDYRLSDLEGRVSREVKVRAAESHLKRKNADSELLEAIKNKEGEPELNLKTWRERAFSR